MRDYEHKFMIAYNRSTSNLRISFPDAVKFPHMRAWVWLQDVSTVVISPARPKSVRGVQALTLSPRDIQKCRVMNFGPISHGIGNHFRNAETSFRHEDGRFFIKIPDECDRLPPKNRGNRKLPPIEITTSVDARGGVAPQKSPTILEDNHLVLIERGNQELSFSVPEHVLKDVIGHWVLDGYLVRD